MERRKSERVRSETRVVLRACSAKTEKDLADPFYAWVVDLSPYGACIKIESIRQDNIHLFYGPQEHDDFVLFMRFFSDSGEEKEIRLIPIWFNKELDCDPPFYRLGVEFDVDTPKKIIKELLAAVKESNVISRWLQEIFRTIGTIPAQAF